MRSNEGDEEVGPTCEQNIGVLAKDIGHLSQYVN